MKFADAISSHGYLVLPRCLSPEEVANINQYFDLEKESFKSAKVGKAHNHRQNTEIRGDETFWLDTLNYHPAFKAPFKILQDLKMELNRELFLGLKDFECHLAKYPPGTFYKKHVDRFQADSTRAFSFIFYLNENWKAGDGGELQLYDRQDYLLKSIEPVAGTLVGFISQDFPHEVLLCQKERRSLTGWIHTKGLL